VLEPLRGYLMLAEQLYLQGADYAEAWNFGPHDEDSKPVGWIVQQMAALWGSGAQWKCDTAAHPHEAHYLKLDISKARSRLDWQPALRLVQALDLSIAWARQHQAGADMHAFTNGQIAAYQTLTQH
jgi:CDP-glucose 4,6-dehydratase